MKHKGKMYDFTDFIEVINTHGISVEMYTADFKEFRNELSRGKDTKFPHLSDVVEACFKTNSSKMFWKENLSGTVYKHGEFLQKKFRKLVFSRQNIKIQGRPHGLNTQKLQDIVTKLGPIIPSEKMKFWTDIPIRDTSRDLAENIKELPQMLII